MDIETKRKVYFKIKELREAMAGSNVKDTGVLAKIFTELMYYLDEIVLSQGKVTELTSIFFILRDDIGPLILDIEGYGDRLKPDQKLCDILNGSYFRDVR